jgi:hypothetical protein
MHGGTLVGEWETFMDTVRAAGKTVTVILACAMVLSLGMTVGCRAPEKDASDTPGTAAATPTELLDIDTLAAVQNGGEAPSFDVPAPHTITEIMTYHWNDGTGAPPGEISLEAGDGTVYGPWQAVGKDGQGGVENAYWWVYPEEEIPAGTYTLIDSDPSTWSQNDETGGVGVALVMGIPLGD